MQPKRLSVLGVGLLGGSLGDIFGERRVFSVGVAGFGIVAHTYSSGRGAMRAGISSATWSIDSGVRMFWSVSMNA